MRRGGVGGEGQLPPFARPRRRRGGRRGCFTLITVAVASAALAVRHSSAGRSSSSARLSSSGGGTTEDRLRSMNIKFLPGWREPNPRDLLLEKKILKASDPVQLYEELGRWLSHNVSFRYPGDPNDKDMPPELKDLNANHIAFAFEKEPWSPDEGLIQEFHKNTLTTKNACLYLKRMGDFQRNEDALTRLLGGAYKNFKHSWKAMEDRTTRETLPWYTGIEKSNGYILHDICQDLLLHPGAAVEKLEAHIDPDCLANTLYALGTLPNLNPPATELPDLLVALAGQYATEKRFELASVPKLLYGLAWTARLFQDAEEVFRESGNDAFDHFDLPLYAQNLSTLTFGRPVSEEAFEALEALLMESRPEDGEPKAKGLSPQEALQCLYAFSHLGFRPRAGTTALLISQSLLGLERFDARSLMELAYALAKCADVQGFQTLVPAERLQRMEKLFLATGVKSLSMGVCSTFLWSLTELRYKPSTTLLDQIFDFQGPVQRDSLMLPRNFAEAVGALGRLEYMPSFLTWVILRRGINRNLGIFPMRETIQTMRGLAALDKCHRPDMEDWYTEEPDDGISFQPPVVPLMESLWRRFRELLVAGEEPDQGDLVPLFEAYYYAKIVEEKYNPKPLGVPEVLPDQHLELPPKHEKTLLKALKACETAQRGWEPELDSEMNQILRGLGYNVAKARAGVGLFKAVCVGSADAKAFASKPTSRGVADSMDEDDAPCRVGVFWVYEDELARNGNGVPFSLSLRSKVSRFKGYEPMYIIKEEYERLSTPEEKERMLRNRIKETCERAVKERRLEKLREIEREKGEPYVPNQFASIIGERAKKLPHPMPFPDRPTLVNFDEWKKYAYPDYDELEAKEEIPRKKWYDFEIPVEPRRQMYAPA